MPGSGGQTGSGSPVVCSALESALWLYLFVREPEYRNLVFCGVRLDCREVKW